MRYIGGKARTASKILEAINEYRGQRSRYLEPFLGGASVGAVVAPHFGYSLLSDAHPDLWLLWSAIANGWVPPAEMSHDEYDRLRSTPVPSALRGWAGFACSYNGKYFGGYGPRADAAGRDYLAEAQRAVLRKSSGLRKANRIIPADYRAYRPDHRYVVYCDPPYVGTLTFRGMEPFDTDQFWICMDEWSEAGALVLVSEYECPEHWKAVFEVDRVATVHHSSSPPKRREGLFIRRDKKEDHGRVT